MKKVTVVGDGDILKCQPHCVVEMPLENVGICVPIIHVYLGKSKQ